MDDGRMDDGWRLNMDTAQIARHCNVSDFKTKMPSIINKTQSDIPMEPPGVLSTQSACYKSNGREGSFLKRRNVQNTNTSDFFRPKPRFCVCVF